MPKLTKEEFISKYKDYIVKDDNKLDIAFLEDTTDSFIEEDKSEEISTLKEEIEALKGQLEAKEVAYNDLEKRYVDRFMTGSDTFEEKAEEIEEPKEEEVIDNKEI